MVVSLAVLEHHIRDTWTGWNVQPFTDNGELTATGMIWARALKTLTEDEAEEIFYHLVRVMRDFQPALPQVIHAQATLRAQKAPAYKPALPPAKVNTGSLTKEERLHNVREMMRVIGEGKGEWPKFILSDPEVIANYDRIKARDSMRTANA